MRQRGRRPVFRWRFGSSVAAAIVGLTQRRCCDVAIIFPGNRHYLVHRRADCLGLERVVLKLDTPPPKVETYRFNPLAATLNVEQYAN